MSMRRIAAFSLSLLLSLGAVTAARAHPWHVPHVPVNGSGHAPVPPPAVHAPAPHIPVPVPHWHGGTPAGDGGLWHALPVAASGASHFSGGGHWHGGGAHDWDHHHWHHDWGHGDIRYFDDDDDWFAWQNGYWYNGWYGPRFGWWWVVSDVWFFYPVPVYPYPNPYVPSGWTAPPPPAGDSAAAGSYWYFCPASNGYYPYVPSCPSGWQQVPSQPNSAQPAEQQPPPPDGPPGG